MLSFEDVLKEFDIFLQTASYLEVLPCRWGDVRLFNEGDPSLLGRYSYWFGPAHEATATSCVS